MSVSLATARPSIHARGSAAPLDNSYCSTGYKLLLNLPGNPGLARSNIDVYFGSDSKLRQVNARLDGETRSRDNSALIVRLQVVHIRACAMNLFADGVPGAMHKILAESLLLDVASGGVIHIESMDHFVIADSRRHALDSSIASVAHNFEDIPDRVGRRGTAIARPSDVVEHGARAVEFRPHVDQHRVPFVDREACFGRRLIMRIRHVCIDAHDRSMIGHQSGLRESVANESIHLPFGDRFSGLQSNANLLERRGAHPVHPPAGFEMHLQLFRGPAS